MACEGLAALNTVLYPLHWWRKGENTPLNIRKEVKVPLWKIANWEPWKNNLLFTQNTPAYNNVPFKFGCNKISSYGINSHIWSNEPSLRLWIWRREKYLLAYFGAWCCITELSLVTEDSAAVEVSFRWPFTEILNLFCDFDHNKAIQSFPQDNPPYDMPSN